MPPCRHQICHTAAAFGFKFSASTSLDLQAASAFIRSRSLSGGSGWKGLVGYGQTPCPFLVALSLLCTEYGVTITVLGLEVLTHTDKMYSVLCTSFALAT